MVTPGGLQEGLPTAHAAADEDFIIPAGLGDTAGWAQ